MAYSLNAANNAQAEGASPQTATYPSTPSSGSLLIAVLKRNSQSGTPTIQDGNSNAFTQLASLNYNGTSAQLLVFGLIAGASQNKSITTSGTGTHFLDIYEFPYSGGTLPAIGSILDGTVQTATGASGTTTSGSQPSITTSNANDLLLTAIGWSATVTSPSFANATLLQSNASGLIQMADAYQIETATGTYNPSASWTSSRAWGQITLALLPGSGGGGGSPTVSNDVSMWALPVNQPLRNRVPKRQQPQPPSEARYLTGAAPQAPTNLTASPDNEYRVRMQWTDTNNDYTSFSIERKTGVGGTYSQVGVTANTFYIDLTCSASTLYYYRVKAQSNNGYSSPSNEVSVLTSYANAPWTAKIEGWLFPGDTYSPKTEYQDGRQLFMLKPEYATINSSGVIVQENDPPADAYSSSNAASIRAYSFNQFFTCSGNYANFHTLMGSSTNQSNGITTLLNLCQTAGFTGVELDWEGYSSWTAGDYSTFKTFLSSLVSTFHANNLKVVVCGPPIGSTAVYSDLAQSYYPFKYEEIAPLIDYVCVLAYDYEYDYGAGSPVQPTAWLQAIIDWTVAKVGWNNLGQIIIGMPSYGYHGTTGGFSITLDAYQQSTGYTGFGTASRDTSSQEMMWTNAGTSYVYSDTTTLNAKRKVIEDKGILNVSVWYIGGNLWFNARNEPVQYMDFIPHTNQELVNYHKISVTDY